MENTKFNVGDDVILLPLYAKGLLRDEYAGVMFTISKIDSKYQYLGKTTTRIDFEGYKDRLWVEPHEIRRLTPLEKAMK